MSAIFILSGIGKIGAFAGTQGYMEAYGLPGFLLTPIAFEIGAGLLLLVGFQTRTVAYFTREPVQQMGSSSELFLRSQRGGGMRSNLFFGNLRHGA